MLGDFELASLLGSGGMGQVWLARHRLTGANVAVKVLTAMRQQRANDRAAFRDEVHAVAAMSHPNVLQIFDYGFAHHSLNDGEILEGTPWFAAELAEGDLSSFPIGTWEEARNALDQILDALAHAHSRGVIHRDLKPENVLVVPERARVRLKLADFGIAERYRTADDYTDAATRSRAVGTPSFMPPEQFLGLWRDYGPQTDLYALGCLAHVLLSGNPPFSGSSPVEIALKHMEEPPPELEPNFDIPSGVAQWVASLLEKDPTLRPQSAAEAAWQLRAARRTPLLRGARTATELATAPTLDSGPSATVPRGLFADAGPTLQVFATAPMQPLLADSPRGGDPTRSPHPVPTDWRAPAFVPSATRLELGLSLAAIREPQFVHREDARDELWAALVQAANGNVSQLVWVHGPRGIGKTRLARWLCDRATELGAAIPFWFEHDSWWESSGAITQTLDRALRTQGLDTVQAHERLVRLWGDDPIVDAAMELVRPKSQDDDDRIRRAYFGSRSERFRAVGEVLRQLSGRRVPIVVVDDVHWSSNALALAESLGSYASEPGFVVIATSEDMPEDAPGHLGDRVRDTLMSSARCELALDPLPRQEQRDLVRAILPLADAFADTIADCTDGVPLQAVQELAAQLDAGQIKRIGSGAFSRVDSGPSETGATIDAIERRIDAIIADMPLAAPALELAAVQGKRVNRQLWHDVAANIDITIPVPLEDLLLLRRLGVAERDGWSFAHQDIRNALLRRSRRAKRFASLSRATASLLDGHASADASERKARLLIDARCFDEALPYIRTVWTARYRSDDFGTATRVLDEYIAALDGAHVPPHDERRGSARIMRARVDFVAGAPLRAREEVALALVEGVQHGWQTTLARAHEIAGRIAVNLDGDLDTAVTAYEQGLLYVPESDDPMAEARILQGLAFIDVHHKADPQSARRRLARARVVVESHGDRRDRVNLELEEVLILRLEGDLETAQQQLEAFCERFERTGFRYAHAVASNVLGDVQRMRGAVDDALRSYEESRRLYELIGTSHEETDVNLAIVELLRGNYDRVRELMAPVEAFFAEQQYTVPLAYTLLARAPCEVADRNLEEFDAVWAAVTEIAEDVQVIDPDFALLLRASADLLWEAEEAERGRPVYEACLAQYEALDDQAALAEVRQRLAAW